MASSPKRARGSSRTGLCSTTNPSPGYRFDKALRIRKRREFLLIQDRGRKRHSPHFITISVDRPGLDNSRIGITVSRKIGNAVHRNRLRRRVREFLRLHRRELPRGRDFVFVAKSGAAELSYATVVDELATLLGLQQKVASL
jgi:ribonuclease P protein component